MYTSNTVESDCFWGSLIFPNTIVSRARQKNKVFSWIALHAFVYIFCIRLSKIYEKLKCFAFMIHYNGISSSLGYIWRLCITFTQRKVMHRNNRDSVRLSPLSIHRELRLGSWFSMMSWIHELGLCVQGYSRCLKGFMYLYSNDSISRLCTSHLNPHQQTLYKNRAVILSPLHHFVWSYCRSANQWLALSHSILIAYLHTHLFLPFLRRM